jgi:hypothetical protein
VCVLNKSVREVQVCVCVCVLNKSVREVQGWTWKSDGSGEPATRLFKLNIYEGRGTRGAAIMYACSRAIPFMLLHKRTSAFQC